MKNEAYFVMAQTGLVTPVAWSSPGMAKTASIGAFSRKRGRKLFVIVGSTEEPADMGGYCVPDAERGVVRKMPREWAHIASEEPVDLFFDEITCCSPAQQAVQLKIIHERKVGDVNLHPETVMMAAGNPPEQAANGFPLEPPMANRVYHHPWELDEDAWRTGMLSGTFPDPTFPILPGNWRDFLGAVGGLITGYLSKHRTALNRYPDAKNASQASGAWPSPRSWHHAAIGMAAAMAAGCREEIQAQLLAGCVGASVAQEFAMWKRSLDLPDPEELLLWADGARVGKPTRNYPGSKSAEYVHPTGRPDRLIATLASLSAAVVGQPSEDRWMSAAYVMSLACDEAPDIAYICMQPMAGHMPKGLHTYDPKNGLKFPPKMMTHLVKLLSRIEATA